METIADASAGQEATLKRVYLSSQLLVIESENPAFEDLKYAMGKSDPIRILGRSQGIVRTGNSRYCS